MQYDSKIPIYLQVIDSIKTDIINERIKCGQKLPSSRELAVTYTINPNTAARVYQELEKEGLVEMRRGRLPPPRMRKASESTETVPSSSLQRAM